MKPANASSSPDSGQPIGILLAAGRGSRFDPSGTQNKLLVTLPQGAEAGLPIAFVAARRLRNALSRVIAVVDGSPDLTPAQAAHQRTLGDLLAKAGCEVIASPRAYLGMGASLADAVQASLHAKVSTVGPTSGAPAAAGSSAAPTANGTPSAQAAAAGTTADPSARPLAAAAAAPPVVPKGWVVALADMPMIAPATTQDVAAALLAATATDPLALVAPTHDGTRGHPAGIGAGHLDALLALDGDKGAGEWFSRGFVAVETGDAGVLRDIDRTDDLR
jgi:molybdenum cofactor cytidylyltransferase